MNEIGEEHPADEIEEGVEEQDINKEEAEPLDLVEEERKKAHENRKYLRELEAEIERIQKKAEKKIAKIKEQMANIKSGEEHK